MAVVGAFVGVFALVTLIDYVEMMRAAPATSRTSRRSCVAQDLALPRPADHRAHLPFAVLIGAMSCYPRTCRAGSNWWSRAPPASRPGSSSRRRCSSRSCSASWRPRSTIRSPRRCRSARSGSRSELFGRDSRLPRRRGSGFWVRQRERGRPVDHQRQDQPPAGRRAGRRDASSRSIQAGAFRERIEAKSATLEPGYWRLDDARVYASGVPPHERENVRLKTNLTREQVRESFATPETVPFWQLPSYIELAEHAGLGAAGYRLQYYQLLVQPLFLAAMVLLAASVSLRFFRFGGVQKMVLGGVAAGFLLYVLSKISGDMSKAELMPPMLAAWLPALIGGLTGFIALLVPGGRVMSAPVLRRTASSRRRLSGQRSRPSGRGRRSPPAGLPMLGRRTRRTSSLPRAARSPFRGRRSTPGQTGSDARARQRDQLRLHQRARRRRSATSRSTTTASTLEADQVIYDQKTKRLHAEGNVRLTEADGTRHLRRDHRSQRRLPRRLRRFAAPRRRPSRRASRPRAPIASSGNYTVFQSGVYTACEPCKDDPRKPPLWQVKAARIIHDQGEKMMYFEDARARILRHAARLFAVLLGARSDREAQDRLPDPERVVELGLRLRGRRSPTIWALAPNYDFTFTPMITTRQGPLLQGEWRQRLVNGSYSDPRVRHLPARQGRLPAATACRRRAIATGAAASRPPASST